MATQAWLEASLRRSAALGLEVLERASRRSVDWSSTTASQSHSSTDQDSPSPVQRTHTEADRVFAALADLMVQTTNQCKRFYGSDCCSEPSNTEKNHVHRFHTRPATRTTSPSLSSRKHAKTLSSKAAARVAAPGEDFSIEVTPGTYAVTASMPESQQQTQLVSIKAGESINLTFNL